MSESSLCMAYPGGPSASCGGHGSCIMGQCICDAGWTSRGDFELGYYDNCDINILFVKVMAILIIIFSTAQFCLAGYNIATFDDYTWKTLKLPKSLLSIVFFVASFGSIIYSAARLEDTIGNVMGDDVLTSIGLPFYLFFMFIGWTLLSVVFAEFLTKASKVLSAAAQETFRNIARIVHIVAWVIFAVNWVVICFPVAAHLKPDQSDSVLIGFMVYMWLMITSISGLLSKVLFAFNSEMEKYIASGSAADEFRTLYRGTKVLYYIAFHVFNIIVGPSCLLMAGLGYLRRKFTYYMMLLIVCCILPTIFLLALQMKKKKRSKDSSRWNVLARSSTSSSAGTSILSLKKIRTFSFSGKQNTVSAATVLPSDHGQARQQELDLPVEVQGDVERGAWMATPKPDQDKDRDRDRANESTKDKVYAFDGDGGDADEVFEDD